MNSFTLTAIGNLARNPELCARGDSTFARFCLVGDDEVPEGPEGRQSREVVTSLWFFAFGDIAAEIACQARKGDQLILEAKVVAHNWAERGHEQHGCTFLVTGFRFGAKRGGGPAASSRCAMPPGSNR